MSSQTPVKVIVFADDTTEGINIETFIWGNADEIDRLRQSISDEISAFQLNGNANFKGFHACNVGASNWATYQPYYDRMFSALRCSLLTGGIGAGIIIQNEARAKNLGNKFKTWLKDELESQESSIAKAIPSLEKGDYPVIYHRFQQLLPFLALRGSALKNVDSVEYYPDSTGKWLGYNKNAREIIATSGDKTDVGFYTINKIFARAFTSALERLGDIKPGPDIAVFEPRSDESEPLIQLCDAISNFTLALARTVAGLSHASCNEKTGLLINYFPKLNEQAQLDAIVTDENGKVGCTDGEYLRVIDLAEVI